MKNNSAVIVGMMMITLAGVVTWQTIETKNVRRMEGALIGGRGSVSSSISGCGMRGGTCGGVCGTPGWLCRADSRVSGGCVCKDQATVPCGPGNSIFTCGGTCPAASDICTIGTTSCSCKNACVVNGGGFRMCPNPPPQPFYFNVGLGGRCGYDGNASCTVLTGNVCSKIFVYRRCDVNLICSAADNASAMGTCMRSSYSSSY